MSNTLNTPVEALELETYVGLTDVEQREYYSRQERIRGLEASLDPPSEGATGERKRETCQ